MTDIKLMLTGIFLVLISIFILIIDRGLFTIIILIAGIVLGIIGFFWS